MKILQSAIDKIGKLLGRPKTYMTFLDEAEFNELLEIISFWYYEGKTFEVILKNNNKNKAFLSLLQKLKKKSLEKLPPKLYRGMNFKTKKQLTDFTNLLDRGQYKIRKSSSISSWSTSKKIAKRFLSDGIYGKNSGSKYGLLLEINPTYFKDDIIFSTTPMFTTQNDINIFLRLILDKQHKKNINELKMKKPNLNNISDSVAYIQGSLYSVEEKEYILKNPTKNIDKIKYTVEEK